MQPPIESVIEIVRKYGVIPAVALGIGLTACGNDKDPTAQRANGAIDTTASTDGAASTCESGLQVDLRLSDSMRVDPTGTQNTDPAKVDAFRDEIVKTTSRNPHVLEVQYNGSPLDDLHGAVVAEQMVVGGQVVNGACYTKDAAKRVVQFKTLLDVTPIERGVVPADWNNTGVDSQGAFVSDGADRDLPGWIINYSAHTGKPSDKTGVTDRCENPRFPGDITPPGVPKKNPDLPEFTPDKNPQATRHQSVPNATSEGGSGEEGMDPQNDSNKDGYGPGDTVATKPTPDTTPTIPRTAPDGTTPSTGPVGTGPNVPLNPGDGTPATGEVPVDPNN